MLVLAAIVAVIFLSGIWFYNRLITLRSMLQEALSGIDVQLKRRHDLIPNLVEIVKSYSQYEKNLFEQVTRARSQTLSDGLAERGQAEGELSRGLRSLLAVAEAYPDLKANQQFIALHSSLVKIEDELQMARRYYNGTTRDYNIGVRSFPGNVIAGLFGFQPAVFFEIEYATERAVPDVSFTKPCAEVRA